jgi:L-threonylcarbamoyladenylate synthase
MLMDEVEKCALLLLKNEVCVLATDTIPGLVCLASSDSAVKKIFEIKERDANKPVSILCQNLEQAKQYSIINEFAEDFILKNLSGDITFILPQKPNTPLSKYINNSSFTIGFRIPDSILCNQVISKIGPIAATSVNKSGGQSLLTVNEISIAFPNIRHFGFDFSVAKNKPSTVISLVDNNIHVIRGD